MFRKFDLPLHGVGTDGPWAGRGQPLNSKFFNSSFSPNYSCTPIPIGVISNVCLVTPQYVAAADVE